MKNITNKIIALAISTTMALTTLYGCKQNKYELTKEQQNRNKHHQSYEQRSYEIRRAMPGWLPVELEVRLSRQGLHNEGNHYLAKRYLDFDGDGETVEQYVEGIIKSFDFLYPRKNLIRTQNKSFFDNQNTFGLEKIMTEEETMRIDQEYRTLRKLYK